MDESWRRYLQNLLCDPKGLNLRNEISHTLKESGSRYDAALLIRCACVISRMTVEPPAEEERQAE